MRKFAREQMAEATDHHAKMNWATPQSLGDVDYYRIPSALLATKITKLYWDGASDNLGWCPFPPSVKRLHESSTATILKDLIRQASHDLPAATPEQIRHSGLEQLYWAMHNLIPPQDLVGRVEVGMQLLKVIQSEESEDAHPARSFYLEGVIELDLGYDALDAMSNAVSAQQRDAVMRTFEPVLAEAHSNSEKLLLAAYNRNTNSAIEAFENAAGTTGLPILLEPATRQDALIALGDAHLVQGHRTLAIESYNRAIKDFMAQDEPISGEPSMVKVFARLSIINGASSDGHGCNKADRFSGQWQQTWHELGLSVPYGCTIKADSPESSQSTIKSFVDLVRLVGPLGSCQKDWGDSAATPQLEVRGRLACLDRRTQTISTLQPDIEALNAELSVGLSQTDSAPVSQSHK
jgi:tetratricopeptide (TPR) repeat protein